MYVYTFLKSSQHELLKTDTTTASHFSAFVRK